MNISAGPGVAIREFPLKTGVADYLLYVYAKALGTIEAKPQDHTLIGVEEQSAKYVVGLPAGLPSYCLPLPFAYESTGVVTQFTNRLDPDPRSREVFTFHRPEELLRLVNLENQLRWNLRHMPELVTGGLWDVQVQAIRNLEVSLAANHARGVIQMATGSGKTFTATSGCYRLIKFGKAKRILFLVDRTNLGKQALNEFQQFVSPYSNYKFTEEYPVQLLRRNTIDPAAKVCITTIQRLYSILKGEEEFDEENEETSLFESAPSLVKEPMPVVYNPRVPIETFDVIIIDECHRSIYNVWRQVLEYFDTYLIGLTATLTPQAVGFFNGNVIQNYSHEKAVVDGVNVGYDVYRIATKVTQGGATLAKEPGHLVPHRDRRTRKKKLKELEDDLTYTAGDLDRDVVAMDQIRLVVRTFRDRLFTEIFPGRREVPKTLVFAKTDLHADDIVKVIRDEFGRGNDFCQKITSKTTGKKPEDLLNEFRNSYNPRIAVTVDMIATGTDVKPLECLLFMRNISSTSYFEQMKGRGCRVIKSDDLQGVSDPLPAFVEIAANVRASRRHMVGRARTTAGQTGVSGADVREMPIPLPPLAEQVQIVAAVAGCLSQIEAADVAVEHNQRRAARLRQSVLKRAFEGKLVPQDPHDEPASVLLERLRSTRSSHGASDVEQSPAKGRIRRTTAGKDRVPPSPTTARGSP